MPEKNGKQLAGQGLIS